MKKVKLLSIVLCCSTLAFAQKKTNKSNKINTDKTQTGNKGFILNGITEGYDNGNIVFYEIGGSGKYDTVTIKNNKFTYKGTITEPTAFYYLRHDKQNNVVLIDPGTHNMFIDYGNKKPLIISNNPSQDQMNVFNATINPYLVKRNELNKASQQTPNNDSINAVVQANEQSIQQTFLQFVGNENNAVAASFLVSNTLESNPNIPADQSSMMYNSLSQKAKDTKYGKTIYQTINRFTADEIGKIAPDFTLLDSNGKAIKLSDFRGKKFVLVDFWASWCGPCRAEFPALKAAYEQYKDKGFEILGVSIDSDKNKWLNTLKIPNYTNWLHVWDGPQGPKQIANTLYSVPSIPRNFLLDKNGKVIARNLRGSQVEQALKEFIK